jgi:hypothetical protein
MSLFLDFASPAIAAGAVQRRDSKWQMPDGSVVFSARDVLHELGLEPVQVDSPKPRTFRALKAESDRLAAKYKRTATLEIRAAQYAAAMRGEETPHSICLDRPSWTRGVTHGTAADGSKRARFVGNWEIPNWDWTPGEVVEEINPEPAMAEHAPPSDLEVPAEMASAPTECQLTAIAEPLTECPPATVRTPTTASARRPIGYLPRSTIRHDELARAVVPRFDYQHQRLALLSGRRSRDSRALRHGAGFRGRGPPSAAPHST